MAFRWRADYGPILTAGVVALRFQGDPDQDFQKKKTIFVMFQGGGVRTPCPPLDPRMDSATRRMYYMKNMQFWRRK